MKDKYLILYFIVFVAMLLWGLVDFFDLVINFNPSKAKHTDWMLLIIPGSLLILLFFTLLFNNSTVKRILGKEKADRIFLLLSIPFLFAIVAVTVFGIIFEGLRQL